MKYVYVLVSSENDFYAEEALVSMYSLKKHNPTAEITLLTDRRTIDSLQGGRIYFQKYIDNIIIINVSEDLSLIQKSRYIKTSIRDYIEGTFLYIDNDTIITGRLDKLDDLRFDVGAVYNQHREWAEYRCHPMMLDFKNVTGTNPEEENKFSAYYNGGVIFSKDTPEAHKFFRTWHDLWLKSSLEFGFHKDQPAMWHANFLCNNIITPIDGFYNFQAIYPKYSLKYLFNCKIFHYFSSSPIGKKIVFRKPEFMLYIRKHEIDSHIEKCLDNFLSDYIESLEILSDDEVELYNSPMAIFGRKVSERIPSSNKLIKRIFGNKVT